MLTFAIIGLGGRISHVVQNFMAASAGRARCLGYADPAPIGRANLEKHGVDLGRAYADHQSLLAAEKPDVVFVGSPNHLHLTHIRAGLEAGCRVFSEKPVVVDRAQTIELARLLAKHGEHRLLVGLVLRSSPLYRTVKGLLDAKRLGTLVSMEANEHLGPEHGGFLMRDWRRSRAWAGSYLLEKCCHDFDLYNAMIGARGMKVASFGGRNVFTPANAALEQGAGQDGKRRYRAWGRGWQGHDQVFDSDADVLDHQVAIIEFANGVRLAFHSNTHAFGQRRWVICGTHGAIESDLATNRVSLMPVFGKTEEVSSAGTGAGHYGADEEMAKDLVAALLDGRPFTVSPLAAMEAGLLCMAIDEAQRRGGVVDLAPWWQELDAARAAAPARAMAAGAR